MSGQLPPIDAARVLHQALAELDNIKKQIKQPFMAKSTVEASIARLENGLKVKTQGLLAASFIETAAAMQQQQQQHPASAPVSYRPRVRTLPPVQPTAAQRVALFKADFVAKPHTDSARQYLQERFGIEPPAHLRPASERPMQRGFGVGSMARGTTSTAIILPRSIRSDPYAAVPPELTDMELNKGLMHLVNRGLLHIKADLTPALVGGNGAIKTSGLHLHSFQQQFIRPSPTTALEDSLLAASSAPFKLDLLTPVLAPQSQHHPQTMIKSINIGAPEGRQQGDLRGHTQDQDQQQQPQGGTEVPQDPRTFDTLMDTFSLHEFMIRMGKAITNTPEFESYRRTYEPLWDVIAMLINQLESLLLRYAVPLAVVDGKSLADLAQGVVQLEQQPQIQDLLLCLQNIQEVGSLLRQPGRRFLGAGGRGSAATAIQAAWRGLLARRKHSRAGMAASAIQGAWRSHRLRAQLADKLLQARRERNEHFQQLQQRLYQQWEMLQRNAHVVVHVPSMYRRQHMTMAQRDALLVTESAQLARLCDLSEPLVELVLLLPGPPNPDVLSYWDKILQVGNVEEPGSRYRVIWPENHGRLPHQMSITSKILSSPATMKRLRSALAGRLAYVLPGIIGDEEVDLCVQLNVPLLGPAPSVAMAMSSKSGARALLADAGVLVPAGATIVQRSQLEPLQQQQQQLQQQQRQAYGALPLRANTEFQLGPDGEVTVIEPKAPIVAKRQTQYEMDESRVTACTAEALVRSPWVTKWLLKVDDELMGCGHALLKISSIKGAAAVLERVIYEQEQLSGEPASSSPSPSQPLSEPQKVAVHRLNDLLLRQMPRQLSIACREVYPTSREFIMALASRGGVVEACPDHVVGSPCVNLFITPTGQTMMLSTHERIFVAPFRAVGTTFPQLSVPHRALAGAAVSIGAACYRAGLIGHVCVDFVTVREQAGPLRLWAVGLNPIITPSLISFQLFDFLAAGRWDPQTGRYFVDPDLVDDGAEAGDWDGVPDLAAQMTELSITIQQQHRKAEDASRPRVNSADDGNRSGHSSSCCSSHGGISVEQSASALPPPARTAHLAQAEQQRQSSSQRFFFSLDAVTHAGIAAAPCSKLFHRCYQEGLHFDVDLRTGIVLNLSDSYIAGVMGIITVGMTPTDIYEDMQRMLGFIAMRQQEAAEAAVGNPAVQRQQGGGAMLSWGGELALYRDVQALVKYMAEKSIEVANAMAQRQKGL